MNDNVIDLGQVRKERTFGHLRPPLLKAGFPEVVIGCLLGALAETQELAGESFGGLTLSVSAYPAESRLILEINKVPCLNFYWTKYVTFPVFSLLRSKSPLDLLSDEGHAESVRIIEERLRARYVAGALMPIHRVVGYRFFRLLYGPLDTLHLVEQENGESTFIGTLTVDDAQGVFAFETLATPQLEIEPAGDSPT